MTPPTAMAPDASASPVETGFGPARGFDPSRITEQLQSVSGAVLEPIIKRAAEAFYEAALHTAEDYLRENLEYNLTAHMQMLERENQRMRTELYEVDRTLGAPSQSHADRLHGIARLDLGRQQHAELVYAVFRKFDGETRHQTALRYIRERENAVSQPDQSGAA